MPNSKKAGKCIFSFPVPCSLPQKQFFAATSRYIAYGGARGGGKTWSARRKSELLALYYHGMKILILRRSFPQLQKNFIEEMRKELAGVAKYNEGKRQWQFANGSRIDFGYCATEKDADQYQGSEYDVIFIDEATHFTEAQFEKLDACVRGVNNFPKRFYLTCNPGGIGHAWVKRRFVSRMFKEGEEASEYTFIPAKVYDNVHLMKKDPAYVRRLQLLPTDLRRAWLDGDWDVFVGQYFSEWKRETHVIEPFAVPTHWLKYYTMDYGLDMLAGYGVALDEDGGAVVYSELYEGRDNGMGTGGGGLLVGQAAQRVRDVTQGQEIEVFFAPPDLWNRRQDTGRSVAEVFAEHGVHLAKVNNNRVQGWLDLREWLQVKQQAGGKKKPRLQVMANCVNLIESMPMLIHSSQNPNDCANQPHAYTHAPDALRYFVAGRPFTSKESKNAQGETVGGLDGFIEFGV